LTISRRWEKITHSIAVEREQRPPDKERPMYDPSQTKEAAFALRAVARATRLAQQVQQSLVTPALTKGDRSPVTVADYAVQAAVGHWLAEEFPADVLVGEEHSAPLREIAGRQTLEGVTEFLRAQIPSATPEEVCRWIDRGAGEPHDRFWTLDPVDGTKGFLRGEQWAVALALVVDGRVRMGVLGCPRLNGGASADYQGPGSVLIAEAGKGAWVQALTGGPLGRLAVSDRSRPADARVLRSVESGHTNVDAMDDLVAALGAAAEPVLMDSQAKYAVLAAGAGELYFRLLSPKQPDYRERIWDQAAGSLIVEEAGGRVTDLDGKPLDFTQGRTLAANRGLVASNGLLHDAALAAVKKIGAR
jgi:3'(2'), 5'-bisphosphate nucleotidase